MICHRSLPCKPSPVPLGRILLTLIQKLDNLTQCIVVYMAVYGVRQCPPIQPSAFYKPTIPSETPLWGIGIDCDRTTHQAISLEPHQSLGNFLS
jgi:hypothetical protein